MNFVWKRLAAVKIFEYEGGLGGGEGVGMGVVAGEKEEVQEAYGGGVGGCFLWNWRFWISRLKSDSSITDKDIVFLAHTV